LDVIRGRFSCALRRIQTSTRRWRSIGNLWEAGSSSLFRRSRGVPPTFWFTVSRGPNGGLEAAGSETSLPKGACKVPFSWHILTRGNAFDVFGGGHDSRNSRLFRRLEGGGGTQQVAKDFYRCQFGWIGYWPPKKDYHRHAPELIEYHKPVARGLGLPWSLWGNLRSMKLHPRTQTI